MKLIRVTAEFVEILALIRVEMLKFIAIFALQMKFSASIIARKLATVLLVSVSVAAFATLGDGSKKTTPTNPKALLSKRPAYNFKSFSLKTGYNYRGANLLTLRADNKYVPLNNLVTYQKGNSTYILPLKKKLVLDKIKFTPLAPRF